MDQEAKEVADKLERLVNSFTFEPKAVELVEALGSTHRTLQQSLAKVFFLWIKMVGERYAHNIYDARNEESVKRCAEIVAMWEEKANQGELVLDQHGIPYLPTI